jgi:hypothetical protein
MWLEINAVSYFWHLRSINKAFLDLLQTVGSRTATLCSLLRCAYGFSLGACKHTFIWSCL